MYVCMYVYIYIYIYIYICFFFSFFYYIIFYIYFVYFFITIFFGNTLVSCFCILLQFPVYTPKSNPINPSAAGQMAGEFLVDKLYVS